MKRLLFFITIVLSRILLPAQTTGLYNTNAIFPINDETEEYLIQIYNDDFLSNLFDDSYFELKNLSPNINMDLREDIYLIDSSYLYDWDGATSSWVIDEKYINTYDSNGNRTEKLWKDWDISTSSWVNHSKGIYTYDNNGNRTEMVYLKWDGSWVNYWKATITFNSDGNQTEMIDQEWDGATSSWVNWMKLTYAYDSNGNRTEWLRLEWEGSWVYSRKETYTYDSNGNRTEMVYLKWDGSWVNDGKYTYTYDSNGNRTEWIAQEWDGATSSWNISAKATYTYDNNGNWTEIIIQNWKGSWVNIWRYTHTYDSNGNLTDSILQPWDDSISSWVNTSKYTYTYDNNGNRTEKLYLEWDGSWVNSSYDFDYYSIHQVDGINETNISDIAIYPNPFIITTTIEYQLDQPSDVTISIYNHLGEQVEVIQQKQSQGKQQVVCCAKGLPAGIYYFRLQAGEQVATGKMVLMR